MLALQLQLAQFLGVRSNSPEDYVIFTKTYSSQCGFNIVYWEIKSGSGKLRQLYTWEYELVDNVYLPKRVVKKDYSLEGELISEKDCTYNNNKVNQEIPAGTFEYTNLKLKEGDKFVDEIESKEYKYEDANLVEIEKKSEVEQKKQITSGDTKSTAVTGN